MKTSCESPSCTGCHSSHPPTLSSVFNEQLNPISFYRRPLPEPPAVSFNSIKGKAIFMSSLHGGFAESFFSLIQHFRTQDEPAFCGLAALSMSLNALEVDPGRVWKGVWRFFDERMLDCCEPIEVIQQKGITLHKVACLAHCNGANSSMISGNQISLEEFRNQVKQSCRDPAQVMLLCYSRLTFQQTGDGHFSPLGAYDPHSDMILILDVARFKYPPHWVSLPLMWESLKTVDPDSGLSRGYLLLSKRPVTMSQLSSVVSNDNMFLLLSRVKSFPGYVEPSALVCGRDDEAPISIESAFVSLINFISKELTHLFGNPHQENQPYLNLEIPVNLSQLFQDVRNTRLFPILKKIIHSQPDLLQLSPCFLYCNPYFAEFSTLLAMSMHPSTWDFLPTDAMKARVVELTTSERETSSLLLKKEVSFLESQLDALPAPKNNHHHPLHPANHETSASK